MALRHKPNQYTIPRGRMYFNPLIVEGDTETHAGEIYLGNCPSFTISVETEKAEHYSSETGLRQKDASVLLEVKRNGSITCDNMSSENVALFLSGSVKTVDQAAISIAKTETITVIPGRYYQLGADSSNPVGVRKVTDVTVEKGVTELVEGTDFEIDAERGRLQILEGGAVAGGDEVEITYKASATTWKQIASGGVGELLGSLRVVSDNATGGNRDFFFPRVSLIPSGELPVIAEGTDFAQMQFDADVLKPANAEAIYVDGMPIAA